MPSWGWSFARLSITASRGGRRGTDTHQVDRRQPRNLRDDGQPSSLEEFVLVGKGLDHDGHIPSSILAGTFEGLIAGIYLDGGLEAARTFLMPLLDPEIESSAATLHMQNFKSLLQHIAQKKLGSTPNYRVLDERGPDHSKVFHISAVVAGRVFPAAWGSNKKEAEQTAAARAGGTARRRRGRSSTCLDRHRFSSCRAREHTVSRGRRRIRSQCDNRRRAGTIRLRRR